MAKIRKAQGINSQLALAELVGVSQATISKIELHQIPIVHKNENALVKALNLSDAVDLYRDPGEISLDREAHGLPEEDIAEIREIIRIKQQRYSL